MFQSDKNSEYRSNKKMVYVLVGMAVAGLACMIVIFIGVFCYMTNLMQNNNSEAVPNFGTENGTEDTGETESNFDTSVKIINLDEYATPLLEERASLLEVKLSEYVEDYDMEEKESSIIHVMIPEENIEQLYFFCKLSSDEEIVLLTFDRVSGAVTAVKCEYTEEEILNEVWEGISPSDRDIQE